MKFALFAEHQFCLPLPMHLIRWVIAVAPGTEIFVCLAWAICARPVRAQSRLALALSSVIDLLPGTVAHACIA